MLSHKQPVLHLFVFHFIYLGGGLCAELCAELYPSRRCRNVLTEHKHSDSTWKRMSQWSQVDKKKEKQLNLSPRRYAAENPQYGIWIPPLPPLPPSKSCSQHFMWAWELSWMMYCSILVPREPNGLAFCCKGFSGLHKQSRPCQRYWWPLAHVPSIFESDQL